MTPDSSCVPITIAIYASTLRLILQYSHIMIQLTRCTRARSFDDTFKITHFALCHTGTESLLMAKMADFFDGGDVIYS